MKRKSVTITTRCHCRPDPAQKVWDEVLRFLIKDVEKQILKPPRKKKAACTIKELAAQRERLGIQSRRRVMQGKLK